MATYCFFISYIYMITEMAISFWYQITEMAISDVESDRRNFAGLLRRNPA